MTTAVLASPPTRGTGLRTLAALFLALVAAILGAMPGWTLCFAAWLVLSWLALGVVVAASAFLAIRTAFVRDRAGLRVELRQITNVALLMLAMLPMGLLSTGVEFVQARTDLRAQADASARAGGPRLAMTPAAEDWPLSRSGFVYDPAGMLAEPASRRPSAWSAAPVVVALGGGCMRVTHFVGAYYRWRSACDGL